MLNANIVQESNIRKKRRAVYETLTAEEREALRSKTIGHGNMAKCEDATEMTRNTIMRALTGGRILPAKAAAIRLFMAGIRVTNERVNGLVDKSLCLVDGQLIPSTTNPDTHS